MNKFSQALKIGKQQEDQKKLSFEGFSVEQGNELLNVLNQQTKPLLPGDIDTQEQQKIMDQISDIEHILNTEDSSLYVGLIEKYGVTDILLFIESRLQGYGGLGGSIQMYKLRYGLEEKRINLLFYAKPSLERAIIKSLLLDVNNFMGSIVKASNFNEAMMKKIITTAYEMDELGWIDEYDPQSVYNLVFELKEKKQKLFSEQVYMQIFNAWKQEYIFLIKEYGYDSEALSHLEKMKKLHQTFFSNNRETLNRITEEEKHYKDQFDI